MNTRFTRFAAASVVALSLLGAASFAQASALTTTQVSAIISLLQSFGADQSVINNVSSALGGSGDQGSTLSCSSFSDVSYGQFDNSPGGRVSQLQTWLGIPSSTFGFGTYGKRTQAAWNAMCAGMEVDQRPAVPSSFNITSPISGSVLPIDQKTTVSWNIPSSLLNSLPSDFNLYVMLYYQKQGDQTSVNSGAINDGNDALPGSVVWDIPTAARYGLAPGTYRLSADLQATPKDPSRMCVQVPGSKDCAPDAADAAVIARFGLHTATGWFSITGNQPQDNTLSVSPTSGAAPLTVTFTAPPSAGGDYVNFGDGTDGCSVPGVTNDGMTGCSVPTDRPITHTYSQPGTYHIIVSRLLPSTVLGTATITVTGQTSTIPTGTIDQSSLTANANAAYTLSGTATGVASVKVSVGDRNGHGYFYSVPTPVVNGRWQVTSSMGLPSGVYGITLSGYTDAAGTQPVSGAGEGGILTGAYNLTVNANTTSPTITVTGTTRPHVTFTYNLPTSDIQGVYLVSVTTGTNGVSAATQGGVGMGSMFVPSSAPDGRYFLRVLAQMNNRTIVESAPFDLVAQIPTAQQIQSIITLLQSFGASSATMANVQAVLSSGQVPVGMTPVPASINTTQKQAVLDLLEQFGFSHALVNNVSGVLPTSTTLSMCPANAVGQRGQNGQTFKCMCPANLTTKPVWGSPYYTDDSDICTAGVLIGQINMTSGGEIDYMIDPGQSSYNGLTFHGVTAQPYGAWPGSFEIDGPGRG